MSRNTLSDAIDDIKLIKEIIFKTASSVVSLGRILLYWGILFFVKTSLTIFIDSNETYSNQLFKRIPVLFYSIHPLFVCVAICIYIIYVRKIKIEGLGKQLMKIWFFIIALNILSPIFFLVLKKFFQADTSFYYFCTTPISFITFALGLYMTNILTGYKLIKWLCAIYTVLGLISFVPGAIPPYFSQFLWPFTFLLLGGYFEYKRLKARG